MPMSLKTRVTRHRPIEMDSSLSAMAVPVSRREEGSHWQVDCPHDVTWLVYNAVVTCCRGLS